MTKQHFIALADTIAELRPKSTDPTWDFAEATLQWERFRNAMADFCASQNPRFNRSRWLDYIAGECGPNGGKVKHAA